MVYPHRFQTFTSWPLDERLILNGLGALAKSDRIGVAECLRQLLPLQ